MGLLGKLFGADGPAVAAEADDTWQPVSDPEEFYAIDADVGDPDQAIDWCAQVTFENPAAPDAQIFVSTYVAYVTSDGVNYSIGLRYQCTTEADPDWVYAGYEDDPEGEVFGHAGQAQADAREWATLLAGEDPHSREQIPGVFEWDGTPFQMDTE